MTSLIVPDNFSTVSEPVIFTISRDYVGVSNVQINGYTKQVSGGDIPVNVADYFRPDLVSRPATVTGLYDGTLTGRMLFAYIVAHSQRSDQCALVNSRAQVKEKKFLTDIRRQLYIPGALMELSVLWEAQENLYIALTQPKQVPKYNLMVPENKLSGPKYRTLSFKIKEPENIKVHLTNMSREILDTIEYVPVRGEGRVTLCWKNKYGAIDFWPFDPPVKQVSKVSKTRIYSGGYRITDVSAEETTTVTTQIADIRTTKAIADIITAEQVWVSNPDDTFTEVDIVTDTLQILDIEQPSQITIEYKPSKRRI